MSCDIEYCPFCKMRDIDEEELRVIIDKCLCNSTTWRHVMFEDDFPYDRVMTIIFKEIASAIYKEINQYKQHEPIDEYQADPNIG